MSNVTNGIFLAANVIMSEQEKIIATLKSLKLFGVCDDSYISDLARQSRTISCNKGYVLFLHEEQAEKFYIVTKGWIKLFRETLDGSQAVVDILPEGHMFGETSIFQEGVYPYSAEAVEPTEIIVLPISMLKTEIELNQKLALNMLSAMARYRRQQDQEIEHRALQNAPQRIGCFLLRLADQASDGQVVINLPYDKTLVASRLGMQPETFSRALAKLKDATGIEVSGATIKCENLDQLSSYSCSACSSEFPCQDLQDEQKVY